MLPISISSDIELTLVSPSLAPEYLAIVEAQRDYLGQWLQWPHLDLDEAFFVGFIEGCRREYAAGASMACAMLYQGQLVGNIGLKEINNAERKAEIGYWLSQDFQGLGIISQSLQALLTHAFTQLDLDKVELAIATGNLASRRVAERNGFAFSHIVANAEQIQGRSLDHAWYRINRENWSATKQELTSKSKPADVA
ncbi:GNAT family N-acetyltransferase [Ferrimonas aestuarii]|uniref:GNAT family N-acetyltransferase n=1 Tax=Ferrimonas aestuarii TaxID=2569539 RepID=A0A4U1BH52_9GAMM|nr:GNAT family protein [Ferrimonas aestuarii]TKB50064.1 GNAT family N-acetyltransferase [Ferrimonas aestuarii]